MTRSWHKGSAAPCSRIGTALTPRERRTMIGSSSRRSRRQPHEAEALVKTQSQVIDHTQRDPWEVALEQFDIAADKLHLDPNMRRILSTTQRELTVHFPVRMADGVVQVFTGYRVQHNTTRGPGKGGIRYHPSVTLN